MEKKISEAEHLRQKAEELLNISASLSEPETHLPINLSTDQPISLSAGHLSESDTLKLIHELQIHQIELELQNQEITHALSDAKEVAEKYSSLYDFAPSGYFTLTASGEILDLNLAGAKMLGKERSRVKKCLIDFFLSDDTKPIFNRFLAKAFGSESQVTCEVCLTAAAGFPKYLHLTGIIEPNTEHCLIAANDITDRIQAEETLQKSEIKYKNLVENITDVIYEVDNQGYIQYVSPTVKKLVGFEVEEIKGKNFLDLVGENADFLAKRFFVLSEDKEIENEYKILKKSGEPLWIRLSTKARFENGVFTGGSGTATDITERKVAEELVRKSEEKYHDIFESMKDVYYEASIEGILLEISPSIEIVSKGQLTRDSLIGKSFVGFYADPDARNSFYSLLYKQGSVIDYELLLRNNDGSIIPVSISSSLFYDSNGNPAKVTGVLRDITERKRAEMELYTSRQKLLETNSQLELAQQIGHTGSWFFDLASQTLRGSAETKRLFGFCEDEEYFTLDSIEACIPERERVHQALLDLITKETPYDLEYVIYPYGGTRQRVIVSKARLEKDAAGNATSVIGVIQDITEIKLAEKEVRDLNASLEDRIAERTAKLAETVESLHKEVAERKQAEDESQKLLSLMEATFNAIHNGILVVDNRGKVIKANPKFAQMWGIPADILVFGDDNILLDSVFGHLPDPDGFVSKVAELYEKPEAESWDLIELNDGRTFERISKPMYLSGEPKGRVWSFLDITERKRAEAFENELLQLSLQLTGIPADEISAALDRSLGRIGNFLDADRAYIFELNLAENAMNNTHEWCREGIQPEIGSLQNIPFAAFPKWMEALQWHENIVIPSVKGLPDAWRAEREILEPRGIQSLLAIPVLNEQTLVGFVRIDALKKEKKYNASEIKILKVWSNMLAGLINNQRKAESLKESEMRFSLFMDYLPALVFIKDYESRFIFSNKSMDDALGASKWIGLPLAETFGSETADRILSDDQRTLKAGYQKIEESFINLDGTLHEYETRKFVIPVPGQKPLIGGISIDITDRNQAEKRIKKAMDEAEKANMAKSDFLSRMSHELRTPMNSILGFAQLMDMGDLNPAHRKGVSHILKSGNHLLNLINEVLDISRIEAGRLALELEPVQLKRVLEEVMDLVQPQIHNQHLSLELLDSPDNQLFVMADNQRLKQVVLNLLNNAIKYNKPGGSIRIKTDIQPVNDSGIFTIRISITDTGYGISNDNMPKLFMPFERIGAEITETEGTGLGLAIVKKLTEAMRGTVGAKSFFGVGSTFWIELPLADNQINPTERLKVEPAPETAVSHHTGTILYIEDNISNIELVEHVITRKRPGIRLIVNTLGRQTVPLALEYKPDLILLDLDLPDIRGIEVVANLKADERTVSIPVVIITADAMPVQIERLKAAGARNYLTKPLELSQFLRVVDECVKK